MPYCPICGSEFTGRGKVCSDACRKAASRNGKATELLAYIRYCPLVETIIRHAVRSGTLAIISNVKLPALNSLVNQYRYKCWETGELLHLSHYTAASDRGSLHPDNLGIWPAWLNHKQGRRSLSIGKRVSDRDWHNSSLLCSSDDEAFRVLQRHHGKALKQLASTGDLRRPKRLDQFLSLQRRGFKGSFVSVHKMSQSDFEQLCIKFNLTPNPIKPNEEKTSMRKLLKTEVDRQARLYPSMREQLQPFSYELSDYPDDIATDILALAVTHNFNEALDLMGSFNPKTDHHHQQQCDQSQLYAVDIIHWIDDAHQWHTTEVPHPDFYKYNDMDF